MFSVSLLSFSILSHMFFLLLLRSFSVFSCNSLNNCCEFFVPQEILGPPFPRGFTIFPSWRFTIFTIFPLVKEYCKFFMIPLTLKRYLCIWGGSHFFQTLQMNCSKGRLSLKVGDTPELTGSLSLAAQGT